MGWIARRDWLSLVLIAVMLCGCGGFSQPTPQIVTPTTAPTLAAPTATLSPTVTPSPAASSTPTVTPSPTPLPTPEPARLLATAQEGLARLQASAGEADLVCLRYEDTDADGAPEWVALVHQPAAAAPRLSAFVLDDGAAYDLEAGSPELGDPDVGLGEFPTCEIEIRDVNVDGAVEIAIFGRAQGNTTLLHLFAWDGAAYRRLGYFSGDAGVRLVSADGDAEEEIWEGYRVQGAPSLAWYVIHTWEDGTYGWTSERYDWYFADRPHAYPDHRPDYAVVAFYLALNDRDLPGAYDLLLASNRPSYDDWAIGYGTTARVSVGGAHTVPDQTTESRARVAAMVTAWDNEGGVIIGRLWNVEWDVVPTEQGWRLVSSTAEQLEEWSVSYWP
jgi:hypothetical protein